MAYNKNELKLVDDEMDTFFSKPEMETIRVLQNVFKEVVYQNVNDRIGVMRNNQFTLSRILELTKLTKQHRGRIYESILKHFADFDHLSEIISFQVGKRGGRGRKAEMWFTPTGFLQAFNVFPSNKFARKVVACSFKIASWAFLVDAQKRVALEGNLEKTKSDFKSRKFSPWRDFTDKMHISNDPSDWDKPKIYWKIFFYAKNNGWITKPENSNWVYVDQRGLMAARMFWRGHRPCTVPKRSMLTNYWGGKRADENL